jgi:hypothetical protein
VQLILLHFWQACLDALRNSTQDCMCSPNLRLAPTCHTQDMQTRLKWPQMFYSQVQEQHVHSA